MVVGVASLAAMDFTLLSTGISVLIYARGAVPHHGLGLDLRRRPLVRVRVFGRRADGIRRVSR